VLHALIRSIRRELSRALAARAAAGQVPGKRSPGRALRAARRVERTHPDDEPIATLLAEWHARLNAERFGGELGQLPIRVSRRMKSRLGHYAPRRQRQTPEIAISARHVRRHGFEEALVTLLHEMVHQWQDERGLPVDHGAGFRGKAREVGIPARATRKVD
jgi:hypothetical protein